MKQIALVFLGGGLGSVLRYWISLNLNNLESRIPYGTLLVNIIGSLLIGLILGLALRNTSLSNNLVLILATGFCGGFTTFSAFALENETFLREGNIMSFALYSIGSLAVAIMMVALGMWLIRSI